MTTIMPDKEDGGLAWMHVYESEGPHQSCLIAGNRRALEQLRQAIDDALGTRANEGRTQVFARDGEGYHVNVKRVSVLDQLGNPPYVRPSRW